jgi:hypothetical protein
MRGVFAMSRPTKYGYISRTEFPLQLRRIGRGAARGGRGAGAAMAAGIAARRSSQRSGCWGRAKGVSTDRTSMAPVGHRPCEGHWLQGRCGRHGVGGRRGGDAWVGPLVHSGAGHLGKVPCERDGTSHNQSLGDRCNLGAGHSRVGVSNSILLCGQALGSQGDRCEGGAGNGAKRMVPPGSATVLVLRLCNTAWEHGPWHPESRRGNEQNEERGVGRNMCVCEEIKTEVVMVELIGH